MDKKLTYFSYDADNAGRSVGKAVLRDDPRALQAVSDKIQLGNKIIEKWAKERDGQQYSSGGDQGVYAIESKYIKELEQLRKDYNYATNLTISIGVGEHLSESGQALLMAKLKGKNCIVTYDKSTKKEIEKIRKRAKKGKFTSMEEYKIAESYLDKSEPSLKKANGEQLEVAEVVEKPEDDCEYCNQSDGIDPDHCKYCHDEDSAEGEEDCQYCVEASPEAEEECQYCNYDNTQGPVEPELAEQDCEFCKEKDAFDSAENNEEPIPGITGPDSNDDQAVPGSEDEVELAHSMGMNPPELPKPLPPDKRPPIGQGPTSEFIVEAEEAGSNPEDPNQRLDDQRDVPKAHEMDQEDDHSKEVMSSIAEQMREDADPNGTNVDVVGEEDIPSGDNMEDNISRPDGFEQSIPGDTGEVGENQIAEEDDEPDMRSILEEGLDQHSESINKEKAIRSITDALTQFKAAKQSLELSRAQMPQLYQASIGILKAMIDMASMLNLGQAGSSPELGEVQEELTPEAAPEENEWSEPFPAHPDQGGQPKPGHAPSAKAKPGADGGDGQIGQSIKKLPTQNTTKHIARTPIPVGGVNAKGQQKVMDNQGTIRFINRKQGMVQGPSGVPVKPTKN